MIPENVYRFCWVVDFPMFEWDADVKRWGAMHHPFTSPKDEDVSKLEDDPSAQPLWDRMARAYAEQKGLDEPPAWPVESLQGDGFAAALKRGFAGVTGSDAAFLVARNAVDLIGEAREAKDPVECARLLGEAFGLLHDELPLAGGMLGAIRESGCEIDIKFDIEGLEQFDQLADLVPRDDDDSGGGGGGGTEPTPHASPA